MSEWHTALHSSSLTAIILPEGVTSIGTRAFSGCSSLTAIVLPKNLKDIGSQAFANCTELHDVYCNAEEVPSTVGDAFDGSYPEKATLHVPASALDAYKSTEPWSSFGTIAAIEGAEEEAGIITIPAKPVLISTQGGTITVSGLAAGTEVTAYSTSGTQLTTTANDGTATLNTDLTAGSIAIVKMGEHSITIAIK